LLHHPYRIWRLDQLSDPTRELLAVALDRLPADYPADPVAHWTRARGRSRLKLLCRYPTAVQTEVLYNVVSDALELFRKRYPSVRRGREKLFALRWYIEQLARFYYRLSGRIPKRAYDNREQIKRETGRFLRFVRIALRPVDPKAASGSGIVREVCKDFDPALRRGESNSINRADA
jgi:hypothetical protein